MTLRLHQLPDPLLMLSGKLHVLTADGLKVIVLGSSRETRQLPLRMELDGLHVPQMVEQMLVRYLAHRTLLPSTDTTTRERREPNNQRRPSS